MNSVLLSYIGLVIGLLGLSLIASGGYRVLLLVVAGLCALSIFIVVFRKPNRLVNVVTGVPIGHLTIYLSLVLLGIALIEEAWVKEGLISLLVGHLFLGFHFGEAILVATGLKK